MNDMLIITKDLEEDYPDFVIAFNYREIYEKLSPDQKRDLKIKATAFDLLNRILMLNDINDLNYGIIPRDNSIKLFDFRVDFNRALYDEIFFSSFLKVNGSIYPGRPREDQQDKRLVPSILKQSCSNEKQKVREGIEALKLIDKTQFDRALEEAKTEVKTFLDAQDNISGCQIYKLLGLEKDDFVEELQYYCIALKNNYKVVFDVLTQKFKEQH